MTLTPFHIALQVRDLAEARAFYGQTLALPEGRSSECWIDFDMFGHQFVVHLNAALGPNGRIDAVRNAVDGHGVPVPHCGVVLEFDAWRAFADRLRGRVEFVIEPYIRFENEPGEQGTMFFTDPSGNALEFKGFRDIAGQLFAT
ncbi:MAG: VOC family protein [Pseudomonadota bacterium]